MKLHIDGIDLSVEDGSEIAAGQTLGTVSGETSSLGGLRLQLCSIAGFEPPLFSTPEQAEAWSALCPSPSVLIGPGGDAPKPETSALLELRRAHFASPQKNYYAHPPRIERGWKEHLFDIEGRAYLDMSVEPAGLDPTIAAPVAIGQVTWQNIFEGLVSIDETGKVQPQLAKSWDISPDGLTYTFKLQTSVKFHDGEAFDSTAAKFALDRARGKDSVNPQKRFFASIASIETSDAETLVLHLSSPTGSLIYWLGWPASVMGAFRSIPIMSAAARDR